MTALDWLRTIDFSLEKYRGYDIRTRWGRMWIEKDGELICDVPAYESWTYARHHIDTMELA